MDVRVITLGHDASWTGWGWCLADQHGPLQAGHLALGPPNRRHKTKANPNPPLLPTHRLARARAYMHGPLEHVLAEGQLMRRPTDPRVRVVVERPPLKYSSGKASAYVGVARLVGMIEAWGCRPTLGYPWGIEPGPWRKWWGIGGSRKGRDSEHIKADAIEIVERLWGEKWLAPFPRAGRVKDSKRRKAGVKGDVAEAILLSVGSSRHADEAPAAPRGDWPGAPPDRRYTPEGRAGEER